MHASDDLGRASRRENDSLVTTVRDLGLPNNMQLAFLCECRDPFCTAYIRLTLAEYDAQRREQGRILCPGHLAPPDHGRGQAA